MRNDTWFKVRCPHQDLEMWKQMAAAMEMEFSEWCRQKLSEGLAVVTEKKSRKKTVGKIVPDLLDSLKVNVTIDKPVSTGDICQVPFCGHKRWEHRGNFCGHGDCRCIGFQE